MNRLFLLTLLLAPSIAAAQVSGIKLVYKDATVLKMQPEKAGEMAVGQNTVAVFPQELGPPDVFHFDGKRAASPETLAVTSAVSVGEHLYLATGGFGLDVLESKGWQIVQNISGPKMNDISRLDATPDGRTVFTLHDWAPATVTAYERDPKTGQLKRAQVFQSDEVSLVETRRAFEGQPDMKIVIDKAAVRVPNFDYATSSKMSADGQFLFVCNHAMAALVFGRDVKGWKVVDTVRDNFDGKETYGLQFCQAIEAVNGNVFVGGKLRLSWFTFDGKKLTFKKFFVDDGEPKGRGYKTVPYLDNVLSLATSKNGKFLFVAAAEGGGLTVLKIGQDDLEFVGKVNDSPKGTRMLEVATSRDGKHLFAKTTKSQLLIYDLDATFVK